MFNLNWFFISQQKNMLNHFPGLLLAREKNNLIGFTNTHTYYICIDAHKIFTHVPTLSRFSSLLLYFVFSPHFHFFHFRHRITLLIMSVQVLYLPYIQKTATYMNDWNINPWKSNEKRNKNGSYITCEVASMQQVFLF